MAKIQLLIFLAVWKRPKITELCFLGIERLKEHPDYDIETLAVISEYEMITLCEKYNVHYVFHDNNPLGKKKNFGLQEAKKFNFDYLMEIGSDDLILSELLDTYKSINHDFFGIRDIVYLNSETGECRRKIGSSTYGAGRMMSRKLLEKVNFRLWRDDLNRGLDNYSIISVMRKRIGYMQIKDGEFPMVIDIKSKDNIWRFDENLGVEFDKKKLFERLSKKEIELIESLYAGQQD